MKHDNFHDIFESFQSVIGEIRSNSAPKSEIQSLDKDWFNSK